MAHRVPLSPRLRRARCFQLRRPLLVVALVLGLGSAAQAQTSRPPAGPQGQGPRLTQAQRQKMFPEVRRLAVQDHQARIAILQQGERCLAAATSGDGLRACMRQERQALDAQRNQRRQALRQAFASQGIAVPDWSQRPGRRPLAGPGGSGGWDHPAQPSLPLR